MLVFLMLSHVGQIIYRASTDPLQVDQIDHLVPDDLPLWDVVQDLRSTDPT